MGLWVTFAYVNRVFTLASTQTVSESGINATQSNPTRPNRTEPNRTEPNRTEPNRTEQNRAETSRTASNQNIPSKPDQTRPDQTRPDQTRPTQTNPNKTRGVVCGLAFTPVYSINSIPGTGVVYSSVCTISYHHVNPCTTAENKLPANSKSYFRKENVRAVETKESTLIAAIYHGGQ